MKIINHPHNSSQESDGSFASVSTNPATAGSSFKDISSVESSGPSVNFFREQAPPPLSKYPSYFFGSDGTGGDGNNVNFHFNGPERVDVYVYSGHHYYGVQPPMGSVRNAGAIAQNPFLGQHGGNAFLHQHLGSVEERNSIMMEAPEPRGMNEGHVSEIPPLPGFAPQYRSTLQPAEPTAEYNTRSRTRAAENSTGVTTRARKRR